MLTKLVAGLLVVVGLGVVGSTYYMGMTGCPGGSCGFLPSCCEDSGQTEVAASQVSCAEIAACCEASSETAVAACGKAEGACCETATKIVAGEKAPAKDKAADE